MKKLFHFEELRIISPLPCLNNCEYKEEKGKGKEEVPASSFISRMSTYFFSSTTTTTTTTSRNTTMSIEKGNPSTSSSSLRKCSCSKTYERNFISTQRKISKGNDRDKLNSIERLSSEEERRATLNDDDIDDSLLGLRKNKTQMEEEHVHLDVGELGDFEKMRLGALRCNILIINVKRVIWRWTCTCIFIHPYISTTRLQSSPAAPSSYITPFLIF